MLGPKPIYSEFDNMFYGVAQLNAGGCSNGIRTTLPTRARIATNGLRIPQEQTNSITWQEIFETMLLFNNDKIKEHYLSIIWPNILDIMFFFFPEFWYRTKFLE